MEQLFAALNEILKQVQTIWIFLQRPLVQTQLVAFVVAMVMAWLLSTGLWQFVAPRFRAWLKKRGISEDNQKYWQLGVWLLLYNAFPLIGTMTVGLTVQQFRVWGWRAELLAKMIDFLWVLFFYRLFIATLYSVFDEESVRRYHVQFVGPLFAVLMLGWAFSYLLDLNAVSEITLIDLFAHPITLGALFTATVGFYFWSDGAWVGQDVLQKILTKYTSNDAGTVEATLTIGRYIVLAIGLALVFNALNIDPNALLAVGGGLGVGVGFALREVLSNFVSGLILLFERALRPNDIVVVDGKLSIVKKLSVRSTTVRTLDNVEVIVPNQTFLTSSVTTYTGSDRTIRIMISVGVSYNARPKQIRSVLLKLAEQHPLVEALPAPSVFFSEFGDSSINFDLAIWLNDPTTIRRVTSELRFMIWDAFEEQGIEIPFPQRDLHLRSGLPAAWERLPPKSAGDSE